jgi:hypothetical protein
MPLNKLGINDKERTSLNHLTFKANQRFHFNMILPECCRLRIHDEIKPQSDFLISLDTTQFLQNISFRYREPIWEFASSRLSICNEFVKTNLKENAHTVVTYTTFECKVKLYAFLTSDICLYG